MRNVVIVKIGVILIVTVGFVVVLFVRIIDYSEYSGKDSNIDLRMIFLLFAVCAVMFVCCLVGLCCKRMIKVVAKYDTCNKPLQWIFNLFVLCLMFGVFLCVSMVTNDNNDKKIKNIGLDVNVAFWFFGVLGWTIIGCCGCMIVCGVVSSAQTDKN